MTTGAQTDAGAAEGARSAHRSPKRTVLLAVKDIFAEVGGGQTAYRAIVMQQPDTLFYYFAQEEALSAPRPANARAVPFRRYYYANVGDLPAEMGHFYAEYLTCWQMARSFVEGAPGTDVDVVDTPDFLMQGLFIRGALEMHGVRVGTVSLALHGTISSALRDQWGEAPSSREMAELRVRERLQYRAADSRYALSEAYGEELTRQSGGHTANYIDPLVIAGAFEPVLPAEDHAPDLLFVGRRERRKGPDIFIDALWSLERSSYREALLIGSDSTGKSGFGGDPMLDAMAQRRGLDVERKAPLKRAALDALYASPVMLFLPSRYDQFNLVALEALRLGAPAFVSNAAGVSRWIRTRIPELSFLTFDLDGARSGAARVRDGLADYRGLRERVIDAVAKRDLAPDVGSLEHMYTPANTQALSAQETLDGIRRRFDSFNRPRDMGARSGHNASRAGLPAWKRAIIDSPLRPAAEAFHHTRVRVMTHLAAQRRGADVSGAFDIADRSPRALEQPDAAMHIEGTRHRSLHMAERTLKDVTAKLQRLSEDVPSHLIGRTSLFTELSRLERARPSGDIVAATYALRMMRWAGHDAHGDLDFVLRTLTKHGFRMEAEAVSAAFAKKDAADDSIAAFLKARLGDNKSKSTGDLAILDDRRGDASPKVSVIVSLYNAASKLPLFLRQLAAQSLAGAHGMEVVLVDSGSPTDEHGVFKAMADDLGLPIVYARSKDRETIQSAWNRGIALARAPYLSFLGVDEGVHPDAYAVLSKSLDDNDDIDWVMADSVVTNVDKHGAFVSDVMTYDRRDYDQSLVYLETCYLSWVGGLYRKTIHDRFGYYDETFRGAGDTEFKSRVLPFIRSKHVASPLGLFLNYPEERTTQHPRAEIEDQRAWYLYRTPAGVAYVWDDRKIGDVEDFFRRCLMYRKSYCGHWSTDFDMANAVAAYMVKRGENPEFAVRALKATSDMLDRMRSLDSIDFRLSPDQRRQVTLQALIDSKREEERDFVQFGLKARPRYEIVNDNRYEQHWYSWSG